MFGVSRLTAWTGSPVRLGVATASLILSLTPSVTASQASLGAHFDVFSWFRWGCVKHSNHERHYGQHRVLWSICFSASLDNPLALTFQVITVELWRMLTVFSWGWLRWRGCTLTAVDPVVVTGEVPALPSALSTATTALPPSQYYLLICRPRPTGGTVQLHNTTSKVYVLTISGFRIWKV